MLVQSSFSEINIMDLKNYREIIEIKAGMSDFSLKVIILNIEKCTTRNNLTIYELLIADRSASVIRKYFAHVKFHKNLSHFSSSYNV